MINLDPDSLLLTFYLILINTRYVNMLENVDKITLHTNTLGKCVKVAHCLKENSSTIASSPVLILFQLRSFVAEL